ncbi:MAG TPA: guanosine monophosphate reductase [Ignavibacteria bacterium]|nr:guanosine monophosphate reductase [Ignavibacteria bacterium]
MNGKNSFSDFSLTYDDISILPDKISEIEHRSDCDTSTDFLGLKLEVPIIASPMNTVCGGKMMKAMAEMKTLGIIHRFNTIEDQINEIKLYFTDDSEYKAAAVGINLTTDIERLKRLVDTGIKIFCIDVANGGSKVVEKFILNIDSIKRDNNLKLIAGNVASYETTMFLIELGVEAIRVGIGNGAMCSTSIKSGIGIGQVDAIQRALYAKRDSDSNVKIIADGGINTPGAMCKAIALGCDAVMFGRVLAGSEQAPGEVLKYNNQLFKKYCGSASFASKQEKKNYIEGEESLVPYKGDVRKIITEFKEGLQSSMSYINSADLNEYKSNATFVKLTSHSFNERKPQV